MHGKGFLIALFSFSSLFLQAQQSNEVYERAKSYMQQGDYDNATLLYGKLIEKEPNNVDYLKDLAFLAYLKRDFAKSIELGKHLTEQPSADVQTYQILALCYKSIADFGNLKKLYKKGISKFPTDGVLRYEYGEILAAEKSWDEAIEQWEQGIKTDASYSGNYFTAANYYAQYNQPFWVIIYGEIFVNLESFTPRTVQVKELMLEAYKKLFTGDYIAKRLAVKNVSAFEKEILKSWLKTAELSGKGITPESLTAMRTRFVLDYYNGSMHKEWPFKIFEIHQFFLKEGTFDVYNQWLFGAASSTGNFQNWLDSHKKEAQAFSEYQKGRLFKMANNQYYK